MQQNALKRSALKIVLNLFYRARHSHEKSLSQLDLTLISFISLPITVALYLTNKRSLFIHHTVATISDYFSSQEISAHS